MKYVVTFLNKYAFRFFALEELFSICEMMNIKLSFDNNFKYDIESEPYLEISFEGIENKSICEEIVQRSVLIKNIMKVYSEGNTIDDIINNINITEFQPEMDFEGTFKYDFDVRGTTWSIEDQNKIFNKWDKFVFKGVINLKNAYKKFVIFNNTINNKSKLFFGLELAGKGSIL